MYRYVIIGASFLMACSADADPNGPPAFSGGPPTGTAGTSSAPGAGGASGAGSTPASGGSGGAGGSALVGAGGAPISQGGSGAIEGNAGGAPLDPGSSGGSSGAPPAGVAGSGNQPPPSDGPFTSLPVNGGASAAFVCPQGVAFGDPLAGMGAVQSVSAPSTSFFAFIEGPVWVGSQNTLFFSDNASGPERIWQLEPPFTTPTIFLPDSGSNGLAVDNDDQLLLADQSDRRVTRVDSASAESLGDVLPSGDYTPNDLVMRSDDNLYFSDPNSSGRGFYRVSPAGQLSGPFTNQNAANAPGAPNGVVLSPDENTLYVGDVQQSFVTSFALLADGAIDTESGEVFVRTQGNTVDGMAVDCAGNLYVGTQTGVEVYAPDATFIGTVPTGEASNATFGGADRRTLFVTSRATLKFVTLGVPGLPD